MGVSHGGIGTYAVALKVSAWFGVQLDGPGRSAAASIP
jgi:hypothetical protein